MNETPWEVYLSGEIHSDWRARIAVSVGERDLPVNLTAPVTDHAASDDVGARILGDVVPIVVHLMMENPHQVWGEPCYPVV